MISNKYNFNNYYSIVKNIKLIVYLESNQINNKILNNLKENCRKTYCNKYIDDDLIIRKEKDKYDKKAKEKWF